MENSAFSELRFKIIDTEESLILNKLTFKNLLANTPLN